MKADRDVRHAMGIGGRGVAEYTGCGDRRRSTEKRVVVVAGDEIEHLSRFIGRARRDRRGPGVDRLHAGILVDNLVRARGERGPIVDRGDRQRDRCGRRGDLAVIDREGEAVAAVDVGNRRVLHRCRLRAGRRDRTKAAVARHADDGKGQRIVLVVGTGQGQRDRLVFERGCIAGNGGRRVVLQVGHIDAHEHALVFDRGKERAQIDRAFATGRVSSRIVGDRRHAAPVADLAIDHEIGCQDDAAEQENHGDHAQQSAAAGNARTNHRNQQRHQDQGGNAECGNRNGSQTEPDRRAADDAISADQEIFASRTRRHDRKHQRRRARSRQLTECIGQLDDIRSGHPIVGTDHRTARDHRFTGENSTHAAGAGHLHDLRSQTAAGGDTQAHFGANDRPDIAATARVGIGIHIHRVVIRRLRECAGRQRAQAQSAEQ